MLKKLLLLIVLIISVGCSNARVRSLNAKYSNHSLEGIASFYGGKYNFKKTASGERFYSYKMTAAHKTLPFGMKVKVTNLDNGKSVKVRINDRGPFVKGRIIDLSAGAFKKIADPDIGVTKVRIDILSDDKTFRYKN